MQQQDQNQNTALTVVEEGNILITYDEKSQVPANIADWTPEERLAFARLRSRFNKPAVGLDLFYNKEITIIGCVFYPIEMTEKGTGEVKQKTRTVFLTTAEECISSLSEVTVRFVRNDLLPFFSEGGKQGMLLQPVTIQILEQRTREPGRRTFAFVIV